MRCAFPLRRRRRRQFQLFITTGAETVGETAAFSSVRGAWRTTVHVQRRTDDRPVPVSAIQPNVRERRRASTTKDHTACLAGRWESQLYRRRLVGRSHGLNDRSTEKLTRSSVNGPVLTTSCDGTKRDEPLNLDGMTDRATGRVKQQRACSSSSSRSSRNRAAARRVDRRPLSCRPGSNLITSELPAEQLPRASTPNVGHPRRTSAPVLT